MKKYIVISVLVCIVICTTSHTSICLPVDLTQAIQDAKISVAVASTGAHSGKSIALTINNLTRAALSVEVPAGTVFIPEDAGEQTILVPQKQLIALQAAETKTVLVGGYCTELSDRCPQTSSAFTIAQTTREPLQALLTCMAPLKNIDENLIQQAIWCVTDGQSVSNITDDGTVNARTIRTFLFKQTGQTDTWYSTKRVPEIAADRSIQNNAFEVTGKIELKAVKPMELTGVVKNAAGEVVWKYPYKTTLPVGEITFDFNLKVRGWKKGDYFIIYTCEGAELVKQKFTI